MQLEHSIISNEDVLFSWREGLIEAAQNPDEATTLARRRRAAAVFHGAYENLSHLPRRMQRSLKRQWKQSVAGIALLLTLSHTLAMVATINVGGTCTLVRAIRRRQQ
jgi:hypothetical protein